MEYFIITDLEKPRRRRPVSDAVKRLKSSTKGAGRIKNKSQLKHILANANRGECAERNVALVWFLFGSLTRITETCYLRVEDIFYSNGSLKSIFRMKKEYAKGGRSRDCALVLKQQRKALLAWRDKRIRDNAFLSDDGSYGGLRGDSPLFLSYKGQRGHKWVKLAFNPKSYKTKDGKEQEIMRCSSMENYIRDLFKKCGFKKGSSHSGRKSTSSYLSDLGVPYDVIQMAIGHLSGDMTDTYIIPDPQRLTDALNGLYSTIPQIGEA